MSFKAVAWTLLAAMALTAVLLFNYWASFQPLSTLAYSGIAMAFAGLANLSFPFRFLGIHKRSAGALILAGGVGLALAALLWPASTIRVAQHETRLDDIMPKLPVFREALGPRSRPARAGHGSHSAVDVRRHEVFDHAPQNPRSGFAHS